jgi:ubiquinone/menaquinone biosynthesis C-methylase UbiE
LAGENVRNAGLEDRIELQRVNGREMTFAANSFPAIMSNSIIHHIPNPRDCIREMVRLIGSNGTIFVRDLMRPKDQKELELLVELHAQGANPHQKKMFAESLHAALTLEEIQEMVAAAGFDRETVQATSDRHWTWAVKKTP